jgi:hypothetical protein
MRTLADGSRLLGPGFMGDVVRRPGCLAGSRGTARRGVRSARSANRRRLVSVQGGVWVAPRQHKRRSRTSADAWRLPGQGQSGSWTPDSGVSREANPEANVSVHGAILVPAGSDHDSSRRATATGSDCGQGPRREPYADSRRARRRTAKASVSIPRYLAAPTTAGAAAHASCWPFSRVRLLRIQSPRASDAPPGTARISVELRRVELRGAERREQCCNSKGAPPYPRAPRPQALPFARSKKRPPSWLGEQARARSRTPACRERLQRGSLSQAAPRTARRAMTARHPCMNP